MRAVLAAACVILVVGACGGDEEDERASTTAPKPAAGAVESAPSEPPPPRPAAEAKRPPAREVTPPEPTPREPLPDGLFAGGVRTDEVAGRISLAVHGGVVMEAEASLGRDGREPVRIRLDVVGEPHADRLVLTGHQAGSYVRVEGGFRDGELILGDLRGGIQKRVVEGPWYAMRR
ncbi:MAG: hypothetical protein ACQEXJ_13735 [Myxococcota bacterium]